MMILKNLLKLDLILTKMSLIILYIKIHSIKKTLSKSNLSIKHSLLYSQLKDTKHLLKKVQLQLKKRSLLIKNDTVIKF